ncbi:MAG: metallophosphoesterase [Clostridiaceae bacterium]
MKKSKSLLRLLVAAVTTVGLISGTTAPVSASTTSTFLYEFDVISDTHIGAGSTAIKNTSTALNCIKNSFPQSRCIVINGDVVDNYQSSSYNTLATVVDYVNKNQADPSYNPTSLSGSTRKLPYVYFNFGNHEFRPTASSSSIPEYYSWSLSQFNTYTRSIQTKLSPNGVTYYDRSSTGSYDLQYVNNTKFFFLGTDTLSYTDDCAYLNPNYQLKYLSSKLDGKLTFLFCHQPPSGAPSNRIYGADTLNCISNTGDLYNVIASHPEVIMFTSHEHNKFSSYPFTNGANFATLGSSSIFGTSSVLEGPEGCHVKVYNNKVVVSGIHYNSANSYTTVTTKTINY